MITDATETVSLYDNAVPDDRLREAIRSGAVPVAVYGLGKMGLPLATAFAELTGNVIGVDIDEERVEQVNEGQCPLDHEPGLPELLASTVADGALTATADPVAAADAATVHAVVVPTGVTDDLEIDLAALEDALHAIARGLSPGDLVVVESTVPPGTSRRVVAPMLAAESDHQKEAFGVAACPERTASGRALTDIRGAYPKIVGGVDDPATRAAELLYGELNDAGVERTSDATTAEAVKVFEGVYRDVNIALANELATFTDAIGVDVNEAIDTANTQPYCDIHRPGIGVGGHCIPYYPYFLMLPFDGPTPLLQTARRINDMMPMRTVQHLRDRLGDRGIDVEDATVLVLGAAYRGGVPETTKSPAKPLCRWLSKIGARPLIVDPIVEDFSGFSATPIRMQTAYNADVDAAVLVTDHEEFDGIDWAAFDRDLVVVDGRQALDLEHTRHECYTIGSG